jgi:hypothetical protein
MSNNPLTTVPPWLKHFLVHVVKRCLGIIDKWIEDVRSADKDAGNQGSPDQT